jgi:hypothetical protein
MRVGFQAAVFAVLVGVAIVYFAVPARAQAQDSCRIWVTDMAAYPARSYGLKGSSAALTRLVSECR